MIPLVHWVTEGCPGGSSLQHSGPRVAIECGIADYTPQSDRQAMYYGRWLGRAQRVGAGVETGREMEYQRCDEGGECRGRETEKGIWQVL